MNYATEYQDYPKTNRNYKSTFFCMIFAKKEDQLNLYNAVNETDYDNPDDLEITTIENALSLETAINQAIDESIEQNVLRDVLTEQRAEVLGVLLSTFNKELYEKELKEDAFSQGLSQGLSQGIEQGRSEGVEQGRTEGAQTKLAEQVQKKLTKGKSVEMIAEELEETAEVIKELIADIQK